jgi:hypothetical protein
MFARSRRSTFILLWSVLLSAPVAWSLALGAMLPMTDWVCGHGGRPAILSVGLVCLLFSLATAGLGVLSLQNDPERNNERTRFLLVLGTWMSVMFALVILFYIIPVFLLNACPP